MKIAYFITGLGLGGAEVVTVHTANQMAARGHKVLLCYLTGGNSHTARIAPGIRTIGLEMRKTPIGLADALRRGKNIIADFQPDVIHSQMFHSNIFCRLLRLLCKIPVLICTEHNKNIESKTRMLIYRLTDPLSDLNTNVSRESTEEFIRRKAFSAGKSLPMYNGIDLGGPLSLPDSGGKRIREQFGISPDDFLFLNVGRLTPAKNHISLIEAFSTLDTGKLMIVGQGKLEEELRRQIDTLGLRDRIILAGAHVHVGDFYAAADCFVLSSAWEGLPMVILEAMNYSLPIVTTAVGGAFETIDDDRWIVPAEDTSELARTMERMLRLSPSERAGISRANREKVKKFDLNAICTQWERLYAHPAATALDIE